MASFGSLKQSIFDKEARKRWVHILYVVIIYWQFDVFEQSNNLILWIGSD